MNEQIKIQNLETKKVDIVRVDEPTVRVLTINEGLPGSPGTSAYLYIAYADDAEGNGFTNTFDESKAYIAILPSMVQIPSPVQADFAGLWKKYTGDGTGETSGFTGTFLAQDGKTVTVENGLITTVAFVNSDWAVDLMTLYNGEAPSFDGSNDYVANSGKAAIYGIALASNGACVLTAIQPIPDGQNVSVVIFVAHNGGTVGRTLTSADVGKTLSAVKDSNSQVTLYLDGADPVAVDVSQLGENIFWLGIIPDFDGWAVSKGSACN